MMLTSAADDASEHHAAVAGAELHAEAAGGGGSGGRRSPRGGGGPRRPVSVGLEVWNGRGGAGEAAAQPARRRRTQAAGECGTGSVNQGGGDKLGGRTEAAVQRGI